MNAPSAAPLVALRRGGDAPRPQPPAPDATGASPGAAPATLECRGVTLRAGSRLLVDALDLRIERGSRWAVLGPNGAGKSTLLATLAGARRADGGAVLLDGRPLEAWDVQALAARRALLPDGWLDPFAATVLDTVLTARFRLGAADERGAAIAREWLARFDCGALAPRDVRSLSRGERQRVAIATALTQEAPLLLLDEPIAHQDPRHQALVIDALAHLAGHTLVASLHDLNAATRLATHALLLTGRGPWHAGRADEVLTAARLSELFGTPIDALAADGGRWFAVRSPG